MTLARSLILHLHAKAKPFHEALLPINIFIEHYYLGRKSEMTSSANIMMMSHLFFPLLLHHSLSHSLTHSLAYSWTETSYQQDKRGEERHGNDRQKRNHCKLKNFLFSLRFFSRVLKLFHFYFIPHPPLSILLK